jgi:electron transport complex protein RnfC
MKFNETELLPGVVIDVNDPKKLGRVKATVPTLFDEAVMNREGMPWIYPLTMTGYQGFSKLMAGSKIWVFKQQSKPREFWYIPMFELNQNTRTVLENYEEPEVLIEGLKIVLSLFKNAKGIIAIEDNKLDAIVNLKKLTKNESNIEIKGVYTKYPQGGERALIYALTGREVNSSMLPADVGCVVNNVDTMFAIYNAIINHKSLYTRVVTITGDAVVEPGNYLVPIGTSFNEVIEAAGGFKRTPEKIIAGGPMMGVAVFTTDIPVTKGTSAILAFKKDQVASSKASACINCGKCLEVCPGRVMPSRLATMAEHGDREGFIENFGMECCECGCCSYICPAKRNLTQSIKSMRKDILASRKK